MWLMTSQLGTFRTRSMLRGFVVPKLILFLPNAGWSAQPFSINFGTYNVSCWSYVIKPVIIQGSTAKVGIFSI